MEEKPIEVKDIVIKDQNQKIFVDNITCSICFGVPKLPAIICQKCESFICTTPCFQNLKNFKKCPNCSELIF